MKKLALIATIFIMLALVFAPSHLAQAGSTFSAVPLTQGGADNTGEPISDLTGDEGTYYDVLGATTRKVMEIVTFNVTGQTGTINHARLHIQYNTGAGYPATTSYVEWYKDASYQSILTIISNTSDVDYYYEFPRSYIDTWAEIGAIQIKLLNDSKNKHIYVDLLEIIVTYDATLASHTDSGRAAPEEDDFDAPGEETVYMKGTGFEAGLQYKVAYYMDTGGADDKVEAEVDTATAGELITSNCLITSYYGFSDTETWAAVVFYPSTITAPDTYAAALTSDYYVIDDTFMVYVTIPEFPTIMAGIAVAGLCFGIYYWMRKRRLVYVKG